MGEFILLDEPLSEKQQEVVETYLMKKYGRIKTCSAVPTTGYDLSGCDTSRENLTGEECKVTCTGSYEPDLNGLVSFDDPATPELEGRAFCRESNGEFELQGCYDGGIVYNSAAAQKLISNKSVLNLDASSHVKLKSDGESVESWTSPPNKYGKEYKFVRNTGSYKGSEVKLVEDANQNKQLDFPNVNSDGWRLKCENYDAIGAVEQFQKLFIFSVEGPSIQPSYDVLSWGTKSSYQGFVKMNNYRAYDPGNSGGYNYTAMTSPDWVDKVLDGNDTLQITTFDNSKTNPLERLTVEFDDTDIKLTNTRGSINKPTGETETLYIGGWRSVPYTFKGKLKNMLYFDEILSDDEMTIITSYLKKKNKIGKRCSIPNDLPIGQPIMLNTYEEEDGLYYADQLTVMCSVSGANIPILECENDGDPFESPILGCDP